MALADRCRGMTRLGERDTFAFEERIHLQRLVDHALEGQLEERGRSAKAAKKSIWLTQEDRLAEWSLASRALELLEVAGRLSAPKFPTLESIVHGYATDLAGLGPLSPGDGAVRQSVAGRSRRA